MLVASFYFVHQKNCYSSYTQEHASWITQFQTCSFALLCSFHYWRSIFSFEICFFFARLYDSFPAWGSHAAVFSLLELCEWMSSYESMEIYSSTCSRHSFEWLASERETPKLTTLFLIFYATIMIAAHKFSLFFLPPGDTSINRSTKQLCSHDLCYRKLYAYMKNFFAAFERVRERERRPEMEIEIKIETLFLPRASNRHSMQIFRHVKFKFFLQTQE